MAIKDDMEDVQEAVINELISDNGLNPLTVGDGEITTAKIADGTVTPAKLSQAYLPLTGGSVTGNVGISGSSSSADGIHYIADNTRSAGGPAGIVMKSGHGNWKIMNSQTIANALEFIDGGAPDVTRMIIDSQGHVILSNVPTSPAGLTTGTIYSDGGTLKIV